MSCKEVSSYLQSLLGNGDAQPQSSRRSENVVQEQIVPAENVSTHVFVVDFVKDLPLGAFIEYKVHLQLLTRKSAVRNCDETKYVLLKTLALIAILTVDFLFNGYYYYCTLSSEVLILALEEVNLFVKCYSDIYGLCACAVVCWCHS